MNGERIRPVNPKEGVVSFEDSCTQAKRLIEKYHNQIAEADNFPFDKGVSEFQPDRAIDFFLKQFPDEVLRDFLGHGVSKMDEVSIVGAFLNVISNKTLKGDYGPLVSGPGTYIPAYRRSPFLILSHYRQDLASRESNDLVRRNNLGLVIEPGAFVVNNKYYPLVNELREMFPGENIIKANELPIYIRGELTDIKEAE
jgi:hypothetical protein